MASKEKKTAYDDDFLTDAKALAGDAQVPAGEEFSLEEILAEYGGSRQQRLLQEVASEAGAAPREKSPSAPADAPQDAPQAPGRPAPGPAEEPGPEAEPVRPEPLSGPDAPETEQPLPEPQDPGEAASPDDALPPPPRPISMEEVVGRTVDAVMEEREELLPEKKRRRGLFSRREMPDTEQLYEQPPQTTETPQTPAAPPEQETIGPEAPLNEAAADAHRDWARLRRPLWPAAVLTALLTALTAADAYGLAIPVWSGDARVHALGNLAVLAAVCVLCRDVFVRAGRQLAQRRCSGDTLIVLSALLAGADCATAGVLAGRSAAGVYVPAACAALTFALWGAERESCGYYDTYRTAAMDDPPYLVTETPGGACKQAGRIRGFWTGAEKLPAPLAWQAALTPVVLMATLVFAGLASLGQGRGADFFLCWSAILSAAASFALPLAWSLPFSRLAGTLQKGGCAVAGWSGADAISRRRAMILTDADLFPPGTIRLNGIKVFGEELPRAVSYAATLVRASGGGLVRLFDDLVRSEGGSYLEYSDLSFYEEGGVSANLRGETVVLGTMSFMRKMEVRLPGNLKLQTGLFLAVDRQLTAVFAVKYSAAENVDWALRMLRRSRIAPILASRDPSITPSLLHRKFSKGVRVDYPPLAARLALSEAESGEGMPRALLFREGLLPYAETVSGSRRAVRAARRSNAIALFGSFAGALLAFYLTFQGSFSLMSPLMLLAFQLLWALTALLVSLAAGR